MKLVPATFSYMVDAAQRVRDRLNEWAKREGHGSKKRLNAAVAALHHDRTGHDPSTSKDKKESQGWATGILNGRQDLRLTDLDAVAELLGEPPGSLVRKPDRNYHELTMLETKLVLYYRSLPEMVRHNWMSFLDYMFRFQQVALEQQGRERQQRTEKARRREAKRSRPKKAG